MKAATIQELKQELTNRSSKDMVEICIRLAKYKKENNFPAQWDPKLGIHVT